MPQAPKRGHRLGFTLIELMITVVIIGVLAMVAYPSFMSQIRKGRRSDAVSALSAVVQAQERWRSNNPSYGTDLTSAWPTGLGLSSSSPNQYYTIALSACSPAAPATCYVATATAVAGKSQASDTGCTTLTVTFSAGTATPTPNDSNRCWAK